MLKVARAGFALLLLLFLGNQRNSGGAERQHLLHSVLLQRLGSSAAWLDDRCSRYAYPDANSHADANPNCDGDSYATAYPDTKIQSVTKASPDSGTASALKEILGVYDLGPSGANEKRDSDLVRH